MVVLYTIKGIVLLIIVFLITLVSIIFALMAVIFGVFAKGFEAVYDKLAELCETIRNNYQSEIARFQNKGKEDTNNDYTTVKTW